MSILREHGLPEDAIAAVSSCIRRHVMPVAQGEGTAEEVCLSNADALAQMANPAYWLHYAQQVRALEFPTGRDWYLSLVKARWPRLHPAVRDLARPHYVRAVGACLDDRDGST
jgi:hypothetical protein